MKIKTYFSNIYFRSSVFLLAGLFLGWIFFHHPEKHQSEKPRMVVKEKKTTWTCAMHPQIRMDHPGKCPICGMDLIPLEQQASDIDPDAVSMTEEAVKLAEVQTSFVEKQSTSRELHLFGKIEPDERLLQTQSAHVPGRIEKLLVNFTGEEVQKGQPLAQIYSPELITGQKELLEAAEMKSIQPQILEAAREKLRRWKLSEEQIADIEKNGEVKTLFNINANVSGIVVSKRVNVGDYVSLGSPLLDIANLSRVWVQFDAYESDLPWLKTGDKITFTLQSGPGEKFSGKVSFIDPVINPQTRVARVRVEIENPGNKLKPEMFVNGTVKAILSNLSNSIIIPQSAVLWTGTRSVVYKKIHGTREPSYKMTEVTLGPEMERNYVVLSGLKEGDEIVTNGTFSVDAAAQLDGKPSMMNGVESSENLSSGNDDSSVKDNFQTGNANEKKYPEVKITEKTETFHVSGNCDMCKERIETAARSVKGVLAADWDVTTKIMRVTYNNKETSNMSIQKVIAGVGHDTEKVKADDKVYEALPECCLYRK